MYHHFEMFFRKISVRFDLRAIRPQGEIGVFFAKYMWNLLYKAQKFKEIRGIKGISDFK